MVGAYSVVEHQSVGEFLVEEGEIGEQQVFVLVDEGFLESAIEAFSRSMVNSTSKCNIADGPSGRAAVGSWLFRPASRRNTDEALHAAHPGATIPD